MKIVHRAQSPFAWQGIWECQSCRSQISFDTDDEKLFAPRFRGSDGVNALKSPEYVYSRGESDWTQDDSHIIGKCPVCKESTRFRRGRT